MNEDFIRVEPWFLSYRNKTKSWLLLWYGAIACSSAAADQHTVRPQVHVFKAKHNCTTQTENRFLSLNTLWVEKRSWTDFTESSKGRRTKATLLAQTLKVTQQHQNKSRAVIINYPTSHGYLQTLKVSNTQTCHFSFMAQKVDCHQLQHKKHSFAFYSTRFFTIFGKQNYKKLA